MSNDTDILGNPMTDDEKALLSAYEHLTQLLALEGLSPAAAANVREAVASLWQAVNDLGLVDEHPGV